MIETRFEIFEWLSLKHHNFDSFVARILRKSSNQRFFDVLKNPHEFEGFNIFSFEAINDQKIASSFFFLAMVTILRIHQKSDSTILINHHENLTLLHELE